MRNPSRFGWYLVGVLLAAPSSHAQDYLPIPPKFVTLIVKYLTNGPGGPILNSLSVFLLSAVTISLTGVMAPGPMTAATLAAGTRHRHAGLVMALGHGLVEFPLMFLIIAGLGRFFEITSVKIAIGLIGGVFLFILGLQMLRDARKPVILTAPTPGRSTFVTGIIMTGGNPYFLLWWATVGLALATQASQFGILAFALFAIIHWLCDLVWLEVLSQAGYRGTRVFSDKSQRLVLALCGLALLFFAAKFLVDAGANLKLILNYPDFARTFNPDIPGLPKITISYAFKIIS
jgi:threonine/homoserine/homoserine lactone efflux protein